MCFEPQKPFKLRYLICFGDKDSPRPDHEIFKQELTDSSPLILET